MINYKPFWDTMKEKHISQYLLQNEYNISSSTISKLRNNGYLSLETIEKLCYILKCDVDKIVSMF